MAQKLVNGVQEVALSITDLSVSLPSVVKQICPGVCVGIQEAPKNCGIIP